MTSTARDSVLHIADLHFWRFTLNPLRLANKRLLGNLNVLRRRREFDMRRVEAYSDAVAQAGIEHVLLTGDFASTSLPEEFAMGRRFVDGLIARGMSVTLMPGNHDVYTFESRRKRRFESYFQGLVPESGLPVLVRLPGGTPLLVVPTVCPNVISSQGRITPREIARTRALLDACDGPLLVAGHYPLLDRTPAYKLTPQRRLRNADALRRAIGESGKHALYVCGHVHRFSYVRDVDYRNVEQLTTGAFFRSDHRAGTSGEFSIIRIHPDRFEVERHTHRDTWVVDEQALEEAGEV